MLGIRLGVKKSFWGYQSLFTHLIQENQKWVSYRLKFHCFPVDLPFKTHLFVVSPHTRTNCCQIPVINLSIMANTSDHEMLSPRRGPITHIIFDMDGLLLDTEKFYTEVQEIILADYGKTFDWSLKPKMMGKKAIEAARIFVEETGISDTMSPEQFLERREEMLLTLFPTCQLMPGVSRLVSHFHANGIPICVATGYEHTKAVNFCLPKSGSANLSIDMKNAQAILKCLFGSSHRRHFELKTQNHGDVFSLMHHVVTGDDPEVKQGKPSPDIFLAAAKRFEEGPVDSSKILVFEDAPSGVGAAKNAGMSVVMVPDPRLDDSFHADADQVISSLSDFNPSDWGLPPLGDAADK